MSWAAPDFHSSPSWSHCWGVHRHCHNQIHGNGNCTVTVHARSYCIASGHVFQLQMIKLLRARNSKCGSRETQEKSPSAWANIGAVSHCQAQRLRWISATGSSGVDQPIVPGTSPQAAPPAWHNVLSAHPVSSDCRTQVPTETVLVGTVTAAKYKMEMARERMAPAAPRERLRSQNIPPRQSVHGSSHPPPVYHSREMRSEGDTGKHLWRVITDINPTCSLLHRMYFKLTLYLTIAHSSFYRFWVFFTLF